MPMIKHLEERSRVIPLLATICAFAVRSYRLGTESLWYDETISAMLANKAIAALIAHTAGDIHPPGYYILLHFWVQVVDPGHSRGLEFLLSWPSLFFGVLIVTLLHALAKRLHNRKVGILAMVMAAVNPYHIWYSQEVRMYTLGAFLGLLCLWTALNVFERLSAVTEIDDREPLTRLRQPRSLFLTLCGYVIAATAGLYTLYYFALVLISINAIILTKWMPAVVRVSGQGPQISATRRAAWSVIAHWFAAQAAILMLWSSWLPIFWRQITQPPVPAWRTEWTLAQFGHNLAETFSALAVGQSLVGPWLYASAMLGVSLFALYRFGFVRHGGERATLFMYVFLPVTLIYLVTLLILPIYHVRYLFIYAPPALIMMSSAITGLAHHSNYLLRSSLLLSVGLLLAIFYGYGIFRYWTAPEYRADDHRAATNLLVSQWRPGDVVLVNAGWAYSALQTYWPAAPHEEGIALPLNEHNFVRLTEVQSVEDLTSIFSFSEPLLLVSGSIGGPENLGWRDPESDFYAIDNRQVLSTLNLLNNCYSRIWHYRIYDTVSDPGGVIRQWLTDHATLIFDHQIPGRDWGRLQLFQLPSSPRDSDCQPQFEEWQPITFGDALQLDKVAVLTEPRIGYQLYVALEWTILSGLPDSGALSMSLRLYNHDDELALQVDEAPQPGTESWTYMAGTGKSKGQILGLPLSSDMQSGTYSLELIVYQQVDGIPLTLPEVSNTTWGQRLRLATLLLQK